jgi:phosphoglycolate phosphatase
VARPPPEEALCVVIETATQRSVETEGVPDYDAVLFDSDGVLVEPPSRERKRAGHRDAFRAVGVEDPDPGHVESLFSGVTLDGLREIAASHDLDPETLWTARERCDERSQLAAFRAGDRTTYDDVGVVRDLPGPRGVVSNNHHSTVEFKLDFFELDPLFDTYYGREMTVESLELKKPNTHYLDRALPDLEAESALYVGDSESDVLAAHCADLDSAFVRRAHTRETELDEEPTYELGSLEELATLVG